MRAEYGHIHRQVAFAFLVVGLLANVTNLLAFQHTVWTQAPLSPFPLASLAAALLYDAYIPMCRCANAVAARQCSLPPPPPLLTPLHLTQDFRLATHVAVVKTNPACHPHAIPASQSEGSIPPEPPPTPFPLPSSPLGDRHRHGGLLPHRVCPRRLLTPHRGR
jgi:hypothetical protein